MGSGHPYRTATLTPPERRPWWQRLRHWFALHVLSPEWQAHRREAGGLWEAGSWSLDVHWRVTCAYDWFRPSEPVHDDRGPIRVTEDWPLPDDEVPRG